MTTLHDSDETRVVETIKGFDAAYEARDVGAMLEFFGEDADITAAPGTFHGKEAMKRFLEWDVWLSPSVRIREAGVDILVSKNAAVTERSIEGIYEGIPYECPTVTAYQLSDDGKIQHMRSYYDKLAIEQQVAARTPGIKGWIEKRVLNYLVAQGEKGLRQP